jgi:hypothetical protein
VAVENQHKTLEKISESYDCKPENFSISCDPGERIIPQSDTQPCSMVRKGPISPELIDEEYSKDEKSRRCSNFYYNRKNRTGDGWSTQKLRTVFIVFLADYFQHYKFLWL